VARPGPGPVRRSHLALVLIASLATALSPAAAADGDPVAPLMTEADPTPASGTEWVELTNPTPVPVDLDGLYLTDHDPCFAPGEGYVETYRWPLEGTLAPAERRALDLPAACLTLADAGDEVVLETENGTERQQVAYGEDADLPAPGSAEALAACEHAARLHGSWGLHPATPGQSNPACGLPAS